MLHKLRPRSVYDVFATIAFLAVVVGGSAYAAATIGASDIESDAIRSRHIKEGSVKKADLASDSVGSSKIKDGRVKAVDIAPGVIPTIPNLASYVRYGSEIPSGTTVAGVFSVRSNNDGTNATNTVAVTGVTLPARASKVLDEEDVNFAPSVVGSDDDAACTGTMANPTAPAGKVCLYGGASGAGTPDGTASGDQIGLGSRLGFTVLVSGTGDVGASGTWAYKQP